MARKQTEQELELESGAEKQPADMDLQKKKALTKRVSKKKDVPTEFAGQKTDQKLPKNDLAKDSYQKGRKKRESAVRLSILALFFLLVILCAAVALFFRDVLAKRGRVIKDPRASIVTAIDAIQARNAAKTLQPAENPTVSGTQAALAPATQSVEPVKPGDIAIKVLNEGAQSGLAGRVKTFLISQGYAKAEADNGSLSNAVGNSIYYDNDKLKDEAANVGRLLAGRRVGSQVGPAGTDEQKSADIVIVLGK